MNAIQKLKEIQTILGVLADGLFRSKSRAALDALIASAAAGEDLPAEVGNDPVDDRSEQNIATLVLQVRPIARAFIHACRAAGIDARIISGTRTYAEQNALYAQGRTAPGPRVTNSAAGYSNHNFGIAFDIGIFVGGKYVEEGAAYRQAAPLGIKLGLSWGGNWKSFQDEPHYEYNPLGLTTAQLRQRKANGEAIF